MSNEYVLDIIGALHQTESKKQINVDIKQLEKVIEKLKEKGWKDEKPRKAGDKTRKERKSYEKPNKPSISKIYALWGVLQRSGKIKSKDKTALDVFVRKYTGVDHVKWLDEVQAQKIIEILKQMIAR